MEPRIRSGKLLGSLGTLILLGTLDSPFDMHAHTQAEELLLPPGRGRTNKSTHQLGVGEQKPQHLQGDKRRLRAKGL